MDLGNRKYDRQRRAVQWIERLRDYLAGMPGKRTYAMNGSAGAEPALVTPKPTPMRFAIAETTETKALSTLDELPVPNMDSVRHAIKASSDWLFNEQNDDGHWVAELEADTTLESYFILFWHFMGKPDHPKIPKLAKVIRACMLPEGGWNTYENGPPEISISVFSYFALKLAGVSADEPDMQRTREKILEIGGATKVNTYTKFHLAFFGQYDWSGVPAIPPEMIFIPSVAPVNIYEMSSWSRTIFVPLSIIYALKPLCPLPPEKHVDELFVGGREQADMRLQRSKKTLSWTNFFLLTDKALKIAEKFPIMPARRIAIKKAEKWMVDRFEASGGLGAILPAMMNSVLALRILGYSEEHPLVREGIRELELLEIHQDKNEIGKPSAGPKRIADSIRIQPCHSPVWDTCISTYALGQEGFKADDPRIAKAIRWLLSKEVKRPGDWQVKNPAPPGGWYFEYANEFYPDVDDTIMTMMGLRSVSPKGADPAVDAALERAMVWVLGMQCKDGGWASFDRDNDMEFLTLVPFADHNAMIDPSTSDITSRTLEMMAVVDPETYTLEHPVVKRGIEFIKKDQCLDGSWFGRWGVNYMYGTWQVLRGLRLIGEDMTKGYVRKGVEWFRSVQQPDGGWGERCDTYEDPSLKGKGPSTPSQTAWAIMGLLAAGMGHSQAVRRGIRYLMENQRPDGTWDEDEWTGTGFPRVFYLKYHYYRHYWPQMALTQYRRFREGLRP